MRPNYFTCTLGQAATANSQTKLYTTISQFLTYQGKQHPNLPAVGFSIPHTEPKDWSYRVLSFQDVDQGSLAFAGRLSALLRAQSVPGTVGLLCHSSAEFLFTWLALMRLGLSVLLIAPQCQPSAIVHLCKSCNVSILFHDAAHAARAQNAAHVTKDEGLEGFLAQSLPIDPSEDIYQLITKPSDADHTFPEVKDTAIAYLHHTSGTSSGLPKPIPQSHRAAFGVLPHLPTSPSIATFTTTPLYHGGIADLFRSWTSNAMIWLFPGKDVPITARNIYHCLDVADTYSKAGGQSEIKYFSSVPYVLQMLEADPRGLSWLQKMDIVGVGGAALPAAVGNSLVDKGVSLISRFGSAECGFIMSSHRDFAMDRDWQYLRNYNPTKLLEFESRDDGLAELVIKPGWPHMAKQNRPDGSFATADLFAPHPAIQGAWLYHSRADSQLTLLTGKKFDPAPLEAAIAISPHLDDVLIFGNDRPFPGALLLRSESSKDMSNQELLDAIKPGIEKMNRESQSHARIPLDMLITVPHQARPLEKSSKGTIIRKAAESRFQDVIEQAYSAQDSAQSVQIEDEDVPRYLIELIQAMTSQSDELRQDMDLFSYGVDSIAGMQLRTRLAKLIPDCKDPLPMSVVEDCGTIRRLSEYVLRKRHGQSDEGVEDDKQLMVDLVEKYSNFETMSSLHGAINGSNGTRELGAVVVLTGATGALGANMLAQMQDQPHISTIYCLVRAKDKTSATARVHQALTQRNLTSLLGSGPDPTSKVQVLPSRLDELNLGLTDEEYTHLAHNATHLIHVAWTVNFRLPLRSFESNIAGLHNLLRLELNSPRPVPPTFTYCSSTAAILRHPTTTTDSSAPTSIPETPSLDLQHASPLGYARSKWVAERICGLAHARTKLHGRISVVRVGQLCGHSADGVWNASEAWPLMLSTVGEVGCLPDLQGECLDWLTVDRAARGVGEVNGVFEDQSQDRSKDGEVIASGRDGEKSAENIDVQVLHVLNPHREPSWQTMLTWLRKHEEFDIVEPTEWLHRLEQREKEGTQHSAVKLLGLWKAAYGSKQETKVKGSGSKPVFAVEKTRQSVPAMRNVVPLDEAYVGRMWTWIKENVR